MFKAALVVVVLQQKHRIAYISMTPVRVSVICDITICYHNLIQRLRLAVSLVKEVELEQDRKMLFSDGLLHVVIPTQALRLEFSRFCAEDFTPQLMRKHRLNDIFQQIQVLFVIYCYQ